jgi:hypothetical protein
MESVLQAGARMQGTQMSRIAYVEYTRSMLRTVVPIGKNVIALFPCVIITFDTLPSFHSRSPATS